MTYRSDGGAAGPSTVLGEGLLVGVRALGGVGNAVLGLPVLGQVEGGDLLGFLNLLLVRLDLALELVDQGLHPLVVLAVLVLQDIDNELLWYCFLLRPAGKSAP